MTGAYYNDSVAVQVEEDEDELFEINLEVVSEKEVSHSVAATRNALLANCLLPMADISGAIPVESNWVKEDLCAFLRMSTAAVFMLNAADKLLPGQFCKFSVMGDRL
ncbi:hypothetical protein QQ045_029531 [Rhodiola kirilowii]